jgi:hypothetical protein
MKLKYWFSKAVPSGADLMSRERYDQIMAERRRQQEVHQLAAEIARELKASGGPK